MARKLTLDESQAALRRLLAELPEQWPPAVEVQRLQAEVARLAADGVFASECHPQGAAALDALTKNLNLCVLLEGLRPQEDSEASISQEMGAHYGDLRASLREFLGDLEGLQQLATLEEKKTVVTTWSLRWENPSSRRVDAEAYETAVRECAAGEELQARLLQQATVTAWTPVLGAAARVEAYLT